MELEFISDRYSLYHLEHFFCHLMEDISVSMDLRHKIRLCFQEAVTNAVVHGNQYDDTKYVYIRLDLLDKKLIIKIKDEGTGFETNKIKNPLQDQNLKAFGGRGLFIIREYADAFEYSQAENTMTMEFAVNP